MPPVLTHKNRQLTVDLSPLVEARLEETTLTADAASASGTLTVKAIQGFAVNKILLIGELGQETSEIIKTHAATAPSGTTITLASNTTYAHPAGTKVYMIEFDAIEFSHSATAGGAKSVLATPSIDADEKYQVYTDTTQTSGFYFARFKETIGNTFGGYSDAIPYGGWASNTVGHLIEQALRNNLMTTLTSAFSRTDCYDVINSGLRFIQGKQLRYPQYNIDDYVLGQTTRGSFKWTLPTDIYDNDSNKSINGVRIGTDADLTYKDPKEFEELLEGQVRNQVRTQAVATDTTLEIDNSNDFADSGSVDFYISGTKYTVTYTGVTRSATAGVLTGIPASGTGSISVTVPVDTWVFQTPIEGTPSYYTVRNGELEVTPMPDATADNKNVFLDYSTIVTEVDSDGDELDIQRYDMMVDYLTWAIKMRLKNNGALDMNDGWFNAFKEKLNDAIRTTRNPRVHRMKPKINSIRY